MPPTFTASYQIVLRFNNKPDGTLEPYIVVPKGGKHAQANSIEASISMADHPLDVFYFTSLVANRTK